MKVAIFARVSTAEQSSDRQLNDLRQLAEQQNWTIEVEITETISRVSKNAQRPAIAELLQLAAAGQIKKVLIAEVSRLGAKVVESVDTIEKLAGFGVSIYVANIGMETLLPDGRENFMFKPILMTLIGFAEMERELLRERIRSGMKTAKKKGKHIGRKKGTTESPAKTLDKYPDVVRQIRKGRSIREAAKLADVSPATVQKVKKALAAAA
jgi:DNA invertase Pin-like site-specific DNA recombinase